MGQDQNLKLIEETELLFRRVWKKYQNFLMFTSSELSMQQMMFLKLLEQKGTCTPSDIAQKFEITLGAVTSFVDRLHKLGLVKRTRSEEDRRVVLIQLSPQGEEALLTFARERKKKLSCLMQRLDPSHLNKLNTALEQLNSVLAELEANPFTE